ncbi:MAG TPA: hypothetical protein VIM00_14800, partial [Candidatus Acidoferrum sp.]
MAEFGVLEGKTFEGCIFVLYGGGHCWRGGCAWVTAADSGESVSGESGDSTGNVLPGRVADTSGAVPVMSPGGRDWADG